MVIRREKWSWKHPATHFLDVSVNFGFLSEFSEERVTNISVLLNILYDNGAQVTQVPQTWYSTKVSILPPFTMPHCFSTRKRLGGDCDTQQEDVESGSHRDRCWSGKRSDSAEAVVLHNDSHKRGEECPSGGKGARWSQQRSAQKQEAVSDAAVCLADMVSRWREKMPG